MHSSKPPIVVVGAGIIGLTTAIRLLQSPSFTSPVYILASHFPSNPLHPAYASTAAGAHHLSFADDEDERQIRWDTRTFDVMSGELEHEGEDATGLMRLKQTECTSRSWLAWVPLETMKNYSDPFSLSTADYDGEEKHLKILERHPEVRPPLLSHSDLWLEKASD
jgi:glycine/D-amino acid oxidase-like deaminating enzyme